MYDDYSYIVTSPVNGVSEFVSDIEYYETLDELSD